MKTTPLIFNLFPRYFDTINKWSEHLPHVQRMGFNHIFINPFHYTGFSGSLYAVKDFYKLNPYFLRDDQDPCDFAPLKMFIAECEKRGIRIMMDLVINHTAIDSVLVDTRPEWFVHDTAGKIVSPFCVDPNDSGNITVWGDLAKLDHEETADRQGLWSFFDELIRFYQDMHINCFRCDAAYQVPADLWQHLISSAKQRYEDTVFFAETLGCRPDQIAELKETGFDYLFNSSKWWHCDAPWCLDQHNENRGIAPSVSFAETHDTERLAKEGPGTLAVQKGRYVLSAVFSEGLLMPMGYEFGATIKTDVVKGSPQDACERPQWDLSEWIAGIHQLKLARPVLREEGTWEALWRYDDEVFFMEKHSRSDPDPVLVCVNKNQTAETEIDADRLPDRVHSYTKMIYPCRDPGESCSFSTPLMLKPAEIVLWIT